MRTLREPPSSRNENTEVDQTRFGADVDWFWVDRHCITMVPISYGIYFGRITYRTVQIAAQIQSEIVSVDAINDSMSTLLVWVILYGTMQGPAPAPNVPKLGEKRFVFDDINLRTYIRNHE